jgi:hypothetical protein
MQPWIIVTMAVVIVVAIMGWLFYDQSRRSHLKERFGPEYDRTVAQTGNRHRAESELARREAHAREIRTQAMSLSDREKCLSQWKLCQAQFVDDPPGAVDRADQLLAEIMRTRGYSAVNPYERMMDIAAAYPHHAEHYREAGRILARHHKGEATTEELRTAFLHFRTLFDDLLGGYDERTRAAS